MEQKKIKSKSKCVFTIFPQKNKCTTHQYQIYTVNLNNKLNINVILECVKVIHSRCIRTYSPKQARIAY